MTVGAAIAAAVLAATSGHSTVSEAAPATVITAAANGSAITPP